MKQFFSLIIIFLLTLSCRSVRTAVTSSDTERRETITASASADSIGFFKERTIVIRDTLVAIQGRHIEGQLNTEEQQIRSVRTGERVPVYKEQRTNGVTAWIAMDTIGNIRFGARADSFAIVIRNLVHERDSIIGARTSKHTASMHVKSEDIIVSDRTTITEKRSFKMWLLSNIHIVSALLFMLWLIGSALFRSQNPLNWLKRK